MPKPKATTSSPAKRPALAAEVSAQLMERSWSRFSLGVQISQESNFLESNLSASLCPPVSDQTPRARRDGVPPPVFQFLRADDAKKSRFVPIAPESETNHRCNVPVTAVSASVSIASISFPPSTITMLKFSSDSPFGVIVAVPVQFASTE
jgi:hypothetical protein